MDIRLSSNLGINIRLSSNFLMHIRLSFNLGINIGLSSDFLMDIRLSLNLDINVWLSSRVQVGVCYGRIIMSSINSSNWGMSIGNRLSRVSIPSWDNTSTSGGHTGKDCNKGFHI